MRERVSDESLPKDLADQRQGDQHQPAARVGGQKTLAREESNQ